MTRPEKPGSSCKPAAWGLTPHHQAPDSNAQTTRTVHTIRPLTAMHKQQGLSTPSGPWQQCTNNKDCPHTQSPVLTRLTWGCYHGGRRPSSDDSFHSPTAIPPSALDKPSIMKRYHHRWTRRWGVTARSLTMVTLHDTRSVECRWWNDSWTVVTWRLSASMIPAPGQAPYKSVEVTAVISGSTIATSHQPSTHNFTRELPCPPLVIHS